jgi:hypothetical protein
MCEECAKKIILEHVGNQAEPVKVKLEKNSKGYNFELSMSGPDFVTCIKAIDEANEVMKIKFGSA